MSGPGGLRGAGVALCAAAILIAVIASAALARDVGPRADNVKAHRADVSDVVPGDGAPFVWYFEYGPTADYGSQSGVVANLGSADDECVVMRLKSLDRATAYHARLTWVIGGVTKHGDDITFTTAAKADEDEPVDYAPGGGDVSDEQLGVTIDNGGPTLLPPRLGQSAATTVTAGGVRVRLPGASVSQLLPRTARIPFGSVVDTRAGTIGITTELTGGATQTASFHGGIFTLRQSSGLAGLIDIVLRTPSRARCTAPPAPRGGARGAALNQLPPRELSRLWGADRGGRYRTHGANSVATVRGTKWLTVERCDGTLTKVSEGSVSVFDRSLGRRRTVRAGGAYLARRA